jgi:soluble lytic murein transglycosylase-like protein
MASRYTWVLLVGLLGSIGSAVCRADIYSYTDEQGVSHFSNVPSDSRYHLLIGSSAAAPAAAHSGKIANWLAKSSTYDAIIESAAVANTLQPALIRALIVVESGFNPRALSKRGAVGLMQLLPETARRYGVADSYDPGQNIRAGTRYLSDLMALFDSNTELALAAYHAGEAAVARYGGHIPPFKETLQYVPSVLKVYRALVAQQRSTTEPT